MFEQTNNFCICLGLFFLLSFGCQQDSKPLDTPVESATPSSSSTGQEPEPVAQQTATPLFDGKTLDGWEDCPFGGNGDSYVNEGVIVIESGYPFSGIRTTEKSLPVENYEISLMARQTQGIDFFCGLTFPVKKSHCTLIVGGWAGGVVGLSSIDDRDASENDSKKIMHFKKDQWYQIRLRVTPDRIQTWIDQELVIDQDITDRKISLRDGMTPSKPLGISNFESITELKDIQITLLHAGNDDG